MKTAVMYGAGNIGRGFIGQLFFLSGYRTQFIDINRTLIDRLNADGGYPHYTTCGEQYRKTEIGNVCGVDGGDPEAVADAIAGAELMATAVGVNILKFIAAPLAGGLHKRCAQGGRPLNILICENKLGADAYLRELVYAHLTDAERAWAEENVGFVECSIGRMVPAVPAQLAAENPLSVCAEEFCMLPIDRDACRGGVPELAHIQPYSPFIFYIQRKLFLHNMTHAMTAYLGALYGDERLWECALRPEIKLLTWMAAEESALALSREHGVDIGPLLGNAADLHYRYENRLLGDTVARVGRDTRRKLSGEDRLVGAYKLCRRHGVKPVGIALGIAAGLHFAGEDDASSSEIAAFAREHGASEALVQYTGLHEAEDFALIGTLYDLLDTQSMQQIVSYVEANKRIQ